MNTDVRPHCTAVRDKLNEKAKILSYKDLFCAQNAGFELKTFKLDISELKTSIFELSFFELAFSDLNEIFEIFIDLGNSELKILELKFGFLSSKTKFRAQNTFELGNSSLVFFPGSNSNVGTWKSLWHLIGRES